MSKQVGQGSFSKVYCKNHVAYKVIRHSVFEDPEDHKNNHIKALDYVVVREMLLLRVHLNYPCRFFCKASGAYICQPYIPYTLSRWGRKYYAKRGIPSLVLAPLLCDVLMDLELLHRQGILHQDLKPQNIMVDDFQRAYLIDFGSSMSVRCVSDSATETVQTLSYRAPEEMIYHIKQRPRRTPALDIWSLGLLWVEGLLGRWDNPLFWEPNWADDEEHIHFEERRQWIFQWLPHMPQLLRKRGCDEDLIELLQLMLSVNPQERPTAVALLQTPCVKRYCRSGLRVARSIHHVSFPPEIPSFSEPQRVTLTLASLKTYQTQAQLIQHKYAEHLKISTLYKVFLALSYFYRFYGGLPYVIEPMDTQSLRPQQEEKLLHTLVHLIFLLNDDISQDTEEARDLLKVSYTVSTECLQRLLACRCPLLSPVPWVQELQRPTKASLSLFFTHLRLQPTLETEALWKHCVQKTQPAFTTT